MIYNIILNSLPTVTFLVVDHDLLEPMLTLQVYKPDCSLPNELIVTIVVWVDPDTAGVLVVSVLPAGSLK